MKKKKGKLKWILLVVLVIAAASFLFGGSEEEKEKPKKTTYKVGETATQNDVKITLKSVKTSKGEKYNEPDKGKVFLICEFEIDNQSEDDLAISSELTFEAYVDDYSLNQDVMGYGLEQFESKNQLDGDVGAGKKMNGIISYQVPNDWKKLEVKVQPDFWDKKIKFTAENK